LKLLYDQNLSRKLVTRLADIFPNANHVQFRGLAEKTDTEIWNFAQLNDFCTNSTDVLYSFRLLFPQNRSLSHPSLCTAIHPIATQTCKRDTLRLAIAALRVQQET
jgi:Domain of unknown function (DUF5615)